MIELRDISKTFKVAKRNAGLGQSVKALFKREYAYIHALDKVSFTIEDGETVGYIGPNGAGKSSTIKIMSGILHPDSGTCMINHRIPWKERIAHVKEIGVVFGQRSQLTWDIPVIDSFSLLKDIYEIPNDLYQKNCKDLCELLDIEEIVRTPVRQLSLGQRMRCEIAASLLHNPKILFLDEPTIGLDAVSKLKVRDFIQRRNQQYGTTIILTTHDMQDIEALSKRIILIGKGKILHDGKLEELKKSASREKLLKIEHNGWITSTLPTGMTYQSNQENYTEISVCIDKCAISAAIAQISQMTEIKDINVESDSVEDIVVSLYRQFNI